MLEICSELSKTVLKIYYFCQHSKKAKKWPNGQSILFLTNSFKKVQIWQICPLKRPNGNPAEIFSWCLREENLISNRAFQVKKIERPN